MRIVRKQYFVNPRLQLPLILSANVLALISVSLILTLNAYTQAHLQNYIFELNLPPGHRFSEVLAQREADYARMCLWIGIAQFVIFNLTAIFLAHRRSQQRATVSEPMLIRRRTSYLGSGAYTR